MLFRSAKRAYWAPRAAPTVIQTTGTAFVIDRVDGQRHWRGRNADFVKSGLDQLRVAERFDWRHRIGLARRAPSFLCRVTSNTDIILHGVVIGAQVVITERPIDAAAIKAEGFEIFRVHARPLREMVDARASVAPTGIAGVEIGRAHV